VEDLSRDSGPSYIKIGFLRYDFFSIQYQAHEKITSLSLRLSNMIVCTGGSASSTA